MLELNLDYMSALVPVQLLESEIYFHWGEKSFLQDIPTPD